MVQRGKLRHALVAQQCHVRGECEHAEAAVGADVARRLVSANMLLARGQRQHESALAVCIHRFTAEAAGHLPHEFRLTCEETDIRSAEAERNADRLAFANRDVGPHLAGCLHEA